MAQQRKIGNSDKSPTAVEWLAEKYNYVTWLRNRDEISPETADEMRKRYLEQAKQMEKDQLHKCASFWSGKEGEIETPIFNQYYNETFGKS